MLVFGVVFFAQLLLLQLLLQVEWWREGWRFRGVQLLHFFVCLLFLRNNLSSAMVRYNAVNARHYSNLYNAFVVKNFSEHMTIMYLSSFFGFSKSVNGRRINRSLDDLKFWYCFLCAVLEIIKKWNFCKAFVRWIMGRGSLAILLSMAWFGIDIQFQV